ncbi:unnamed protein product, partial [Brassica rapa]
MRKAHDQLYLTERIWCAGEGTNGSVHSRFRPIGDDGVAFARTLSPQIRRVLPTTPPSLPIYRLARGWKCRSPATRGKSEKKTMTSDRRGFYTTSSRSLSPPPLLIIQ